jgi:ADP-ribosylglycohydrolase/fructose-1,6-bisphosphatase/inositol monophosphatase family enzyme
MLEAALSLAVDAARQAGALLRADLHRPGGARGGGDKAEADTEAEREIRSRLMAAFPRWGYRGEETGVQAGQAGEPIWLVDPNDGTRDYLAGRRGSAVSIGLVHEGRPVLGVVFAFAYPDDAGDLFAWAEGTGPLRRNGRPVETRLTRRLESADVVLVSSKGDLDPEGNLRNAAPARYRSLASIAHRLAVVAPGEAAAAARCSHPVRGTTARGMRSLRAAGGTVLDESGRAVVYDRMATATRVAPWARRRRWPRSFPSGRGTSTGPWGPQRPARLQRGEAVADSARLARAQGCLLGQVAGDNLGALVEFQSADEVARAYPEGPRRLVDGGRWDLLAGQPTDDSEMALALARSIEGGGGYDPRRAREAYEAWGASRPFDCGLTVRAALQGQPNAGSQANGSLMRASPLGVFAHRLPPQEAAAQARLDSALTHPHQVCGDSVAAFVVAVSHAIDQGDGAEAAYAAAVQWAKEAPAAAAVAEALEAAAQAAPRCDGSSQGWVLIALQNAFHELLHARTVEDGLARTILRGGDTDTNAAIAGALLGAVHGREGLPA